MPAKKKILPAPCPICNRENGTIQLVVFSESNSNLVCRIGHYISEEYKRDKDKIKKGEIDFQDVDKRNEKTRGKVWHSFRIEPKGESKDIEKLQEYIDKYENKRFSKKSISFSPEPIFYELIANTGWCMKPYEKYHGRKRRYSKYHFSKEEYYNVHEEYKQNTPE